LVAWACLLLPLAGACEPGKSAPCIGTIICESWDHSDLIDIHSHAPRPPVALLDGITGWVAAGSGGANNIDQVAAIEALLPPGVG
jgi:hypothetical protein